MTRLLQVVHRDSKLRFSLLAHFKSQLVCLDLVFYFYLLCALTDFLI
jgi:hypothetical protein